MIVRVYVRVFVRVSACACMCACVLGHWSTCLMAVCWYNDGRYTIFDSFCPGWNRVNNNQYSITWCQCTTTTGSECQITWRNQSSTMPSCQGTTCSANQCNSAWRWENSTTPWRLVSHIQRCWPHKKNDVVVDRCLAIKNNVRSPSRKRRCCGNWCNNHIWKGAGAFGNLWSHGKIGNLLAVLVSRCTIRRWYPLLHACCHENWKSALRINRRPDIIYHKSFISLRVA